MAKSFNKPHLRIKGFSESQAYKYPSKTPIKFKKLQRDRNKHGKRIQGLLNKIKEDFQVEKEIELPVEGLYRDDVVYVQFVSPWGFELKFDQLVDNSKKPKYQLLNIQKELSPEIKDEKRNFRYKALVMLNSGGVSHFIKRVNDYLSKNTKYKGEYTKNPVANDLVSNIEDVQVATLKAFWTDGQKFEFPDINREVWWEVWFRKTQDDEHKIIEQLSLIGAEISETKLEFAENSVRLVKATAKQLSESLMLLDNLSELRKPQVLNDFITHDDVTYQDQKEWSEDLFNRTKLHFSENEDDVLVSVFDSGVNNLHPLLKNVIPNQYLETWKPHWGKSDTEPNGGHGTGMAGLVLYGNLTDALANAHDINIYHGVESFKIIHPSEKTEPKLFGVIYRDGCNSLITERPLNKRVFCLAITNDGITDNGRPSSSSSELDNIIFGKLFEGAEPQLFIVSGGNISLNKPEEYPDFNFISSVQDPGQAYNALTVGAYTLMDRLSQDNYQPLAKFGGMSPFNTTSGAWETQWPNKPDIVFEGGNCIIHPSGFVSSHDELSPIGLDSDFRKNLFIPFNGTSSATALASKMAAELKNSYPDFWPETIRALIVHSANWTDEMLKERDFKNSEADRRAILRSVGYGVPNLSDAITSANNSLTLIAEEYISPYRKEKSSIKYNEYHLYKLPWPQDILLHEIAEKDAKITVTLSYFIEPNPGNKQYARSFSYHSHELDFKLIKSGESLNEFKRRISSAAEGVDEDEKPNLKSEDWTIRERIRSKGSIKKDFLETSGAELSDRYYLAVYPKNGWYRTRKKLNKFDSSVRYSLIVTVETIESNVDIYTPVENLIKTAIEVPL